MKPEEVTALCRSNVAMLRHSIDTLYRWHQLQYAPPVGGGTEARAHQLDYLHTSFLAAVPKVQRAVRLSGVAAGDSNAERTVAGAIALDGEGAASQQALELMRKAMAQLERFQQHPSLFVREGETPTADEQHFATAEAFEDRVSSAISHLENFARWRRASERGEEGAADQAEHQREGYNEESRAAKRGLERVGIKPTAILIQNSVAHEVDVLDEATLLEKWGWAAHEAALSRLQAARGEWYRIKHDATLLERIPESKVPATNDDETVRNLEKRVSTLEGHHRRQTAGDLLKLFGVAAGFMAAVWFYVDAQIDRAMNKHREASHSGAAAQTSDEHERKPQEKNTEPPEQPLHRPNVAPVAPSASPPAVPPGSSRSAP
jgi:hypothetical protein